MAPDLLSGGSNGGDGIRGVVGVCSFGSDGTDCALLVGDSVGASFDMV